MNPSPPKKHAVPPAPAGAPPASRAVRWLFLAIACINLVLAIIGAFLPVMPTTVFVLIAAWAAARSSPRLHSWLLQHRVFGPALANWHNGRRVSRRSKFTAAFFMGVSSLWLAYAVRPWWLAGLPILCMLTVLAWLWSRPEPAPEAETEFGSESGSGFKSPPKPKSKPESHPAGDATAAMTTPLPPERE